MREWCVALHRREEHEALRARSLGRPHEPQRRHGVQLLDRRAWLVADRGGQVHHRVDAAQGVAERGRVRQVAERDLNPHALVAEPARVAHEAANRPRLGGEPPQQRGADGSRGPREQDHRRPVSTTRQGERSFRCTSTSPKPASSIQARISDGLKLRLWLQA